MRSGRTPWPAPAPWSPRRWPAAALEQLARRTWPDGRALSLRWIVCHMIDEYAQHNAYADLLRESVDGLTGE